MPPSNYSITTGDCRAGDNLAAAQNTNLPLSLLCVLAGVRPRQFPAPRDTFIAIIIAAFLLKYLPYWPRY